VETFANDKTLAKRNFRPLVDAPHLNETRHSLSYREGILNLPNPETSEVFLWMIFFKIFATKPSRSHDAAIVTQDLESIRLIWIEQHTFWAEVGWHARYFNFLQIFI